MKLAPIKQVRLESLARAPRPLHMGTHISYNEIAALVAEVYEWRRRFGPMTLKELELPIQGICTGCREEIIDGECACIPPRLP